MVLLALTVGCTAYEPPESAPLVRQRYVERLEESRSAGIDLGALSSDDLEVPFELDDAIRDQIVGVARSRREATRVDEILGLIFERLDLEYALTPTRNAVGTFQARQGNCLSFVNLFVGVARNQGLNPFYVEVEDHQKWRHRDGAVVSQGHIVAGLHIDGLLRTFDFLPYRPKSYRQFAILDDLEAVAHYYNNLGAEALLADRNAEAEPLLRAAVALDPTFEKAINNLGVCLARLGRTDEAIDLYHRGLEIAPDQVALLTNLAATYQRLGQLDKAELLFEQLAQQRDTSPFFFVYRGDLALARNQPAEALAEMTEALRRDSEVPEVHVGLARAYLALGDLRKARHHLDRALKLDATHDEALELVPLVQAGVPIERENKTGSGS